MTPKIEVTGRPITPELKEVFGAWGRVKGIVVFDASGIAVDYEDGTTLRFVPVVFPNEGETA